MRISIVAALAFVCLGSSGWPAARAQQVLVGPKKNPQIEAVLAEVSAERIEATIRKLASFGTRHTLSDPDHPTRGIGAARRWIKSELETYARDSGGRLIVEEDSFVQAVAPRVPKPTTLVNLVATLPGDMPASKDRWLVVSGHYDSIPRPMSDVEIDAPGANDDASGTAVSMELARVMSKHHFDATLVFLAVPGEEQGLLGATHWAEKAKQEGRNIEAMITDDIVGNTEGGNGVRDNRRIRVFSEGTPANETEAQARVRRSIGGENDGTSRQLARYLKEVVELYVPNFEVTLIFRRDRYGRGGDHTPFNERGFAAVRLTEPNENFDRQHQKVEGREGHRIRGRGRQGRLRVCGPGGPSERESAGQPRPRPGATEPTSLRDRASGVRHPDRMETEHRARPRRLSGRLEGHLSADLATRSRFRKCRRGRHTANLEG